jgi:hypothetical protein
MSAVSASVSLLQPQVEFMQATNDMLSKENKSFRFKTSKTFLIQRKTKGGMRQRVVRK